MSRAWTFLAGGAMVLGLSLGCRHTQPQAPAENSVTANQPVADVTSQRLASTSDEPLTATKPPELAQYRPERIDILPTPPNGSAVAELPIVTEPSPTVEQPAATVARAPINFGEPPAEKKSTPAPTLGPKEAAPAAVVAPVKISLAPPGTPAPAPVVTPTAVPVATGPAAVPAPTAQPVVAPTVVAAAAPVPAPVPAPTSAQVATPVAVPIITTGAMAAAPSVTAPTPAVATATPASAPTTSTPQEGASPPYYNSPDYSILFGVLDYNARRGAWRLRYADAGEEDRYGGCVTLDGVSRQMEGYASGQFVRVEGTLVDPTSRAISPAYRVKAMRPANAK
jgi:hypothetical protein